MKKEAKQSRLFKFYDQGHISRQVMVCGERYERDCELAIRDNMAKCKYDGVAADMKNFGCGNKEPIQAQLQAAKRVKQIKVELLRRSVYINAKNRKINKRYLDIAYYFFEGRNLESRPFELRDIGVALGMSGAMTKQRFIECLEIIFEYYQEKYKKRKV